MVDVRHEIRQLSLAFEVCWPWPLNVLVYL